MSNRSHISCLLAGALACMLAGCGGGIPETTFEAWANGVKSGNFPAIWEQLSPSARGTVLQIQVRDADLLSAASPAAKTAVEQAFTKNGIDTKNPSFKQARLQPARPAELAADLDGVLKQFQADLAKLPDSRYPKLLAVWSAAASAPLGKSSVQGSRALAAIQSKLPHTADNANVSVVFERVDRLWALSEFEETAAPGMAGGPGAGRPGAGGPPGTPVAMAGTGGPAGPGAADPKNMPAGALPTDRPMPLAGPGAGSDPAMAGKAGEPKMAGDPARPAGAGANAPAMPADGALKMDAKKSAAGKAGGPAMAADPKNAAGPKMAAAGAKPGAADARPGAKGSGATAADARMQAGPGGAGGPVGPGGQQQGEAGSYQHAVLTFAAQAASGQYDGRDAVISSKAKGVLADIRDEKADDGTIEDLKALFATAKPQFDSVKASSAGMLITLKTEDRKLITLTVAKEKGGYKVKDMKIKD